MSEGYVSLGMQEICSRLFFTLCRSIILSITSDIRTIRSEVFTQQSNF